LGSVPLEKISLAPAKEANRSAECCRGNSNDIVKNTNAKTIIDRLLASV
jgi:hypothetical protein